MEFVVHTGHEREHADCDWTSVFDAAQRLHAGLGRVAVPALFRVGSDSRWDCADGAVWSGSIPDLGRLFRDRVRRLFAQLRPVSHDEQIVHGDVAGNVLRRLDRSRVIIDFSPYVRPVAYAEAIIAVDALLWFGASEDVVDLLQPQDRRQLLLRAALIRVLCDGIFYLLHTQASEVRTVLAAYDRVFAAIDVAGCERFDS